jgi:hypothetical protein
LPKKGLTCKDWLGRSLHPLPFLFPFPFLFIYLLIKIAQEKPMAIFSVPHLPRNPFAKKCI